MLSENAAARISLFIANGDSDGLARYLVPCLPAGSPLNPVHDLLNRWSPEFRGFALKVVPWLAEDRVPRLQSAADRIRGVLVAAGRQGVALSGFKMERAERDHALDSLIRSGEVIREHKRTDGRPSDIYRLAKFADGITPADHDDPFSFRPKRLALD